MRVEILLAAFNGARHLEAQIQSILAQTHADWVVTASDDGSTDGTLALLQRHAASDPERFRIVAAGGAQDPLRHFSNLMLAATEPYTMLCDQDDVWLPHKIEAALAAMREMEKRFGHGVPLLVHSDLRVVGPDLEPIAASFWALKGLRPAVQQQLERLLVRNVVTGATMLLNEPLRLLASPIPDTAFMHDWWIALVAAGLGRIEALSDATVLYRQHGHNVIGARAAGLRDVPVLFAQGRMRRYYRKTEAQAGAFLSRHGDGLHPVIRDRVGRYAALEHDGRLRQRIGLVGEGVRDRGILEDLAFLLSG